MKEVSLLHVRHLILFKIIQKTFLHMLMSIVYMSILFFRKTQHRLWLEREVIAQERFRKKREDEDRKLREKQEQEVITCIKKYRQNLV